MSSIEIILTVIFSVGGAGTIIVGLASWLGKVWANRINEAEKAKYAVELEYLKSSLEIRRANEQRNSEARFKIYCDVWNALQDLKMQGDRLWERVSSENMNNFIKGLDKAVLTTNKCRLILNETHFNQLKDIFTAFQEFKYGKDRLLYLRSEIRDDYYIANIEHDIKGQIDSNRHFKVQYESLLENIILEFRKEIGLQA